MRIALFILALTAFSYGQRVVYTPIPFPPVDEADEDAELERFRSEVVSAAKRRSLDGLVALASRETKVDLEPVAARLTRDFTEIVQPPWDQFIGALELGGTFTTTRDAVRGRREFCAPYVYSDFPSALPTWAETGLLPSAIIKPNTPVYERPTTSSPVMGRLGYAIVESISSIAAEASTPPDRGWASVTLTMFPTTRGYVSGDAIRSPDDWHVCFAKESVGWRISRFSPTGFMLE